MNENFKKSFKILFLFLIILLIIQCQIGKSDDQKNGEKTENIETFTTGDTGLSDYSKEQLCGFKEDESWYFTDHMNDPNALLKNIRATLPSEFNWQNNNGVTGIRHQGSCGSCWAFATIGVFESAIKIKLNQTADLSEQFLVSCNTNGYGCSGGYFAYETVINGCPLENCYPYTASDSSCKSGCGLNYEIENWYFIAKGKSDVQEIKSKIYNFGPVGTVVYADSKFMNYTGGVFNGNASGSPNHAVVIVGWDDSKNAWRIKNSWGTGWGESGYMWIKYGCQKIGENSTYIIVKDSDDIPCPPVQAPDTSGCSVTGTISDTTPTFTWTSVPGATSYTLYVIKVSDDSIILRELDIAGSATSYTANPLPQNVEMRWKIKGDSTCGPGPYSPSINFIITGDVPPPPPPPPNTYPAAFKTSNNYFLCAEIGGTKNINATRTSAGPWETFHVQDLGGGYIALIADNGLYVCAENGGGAVLIANRTSLGPWETFYLEDLGGNYYAIKTNNGKYVCAEFGGGGIVIADRDTIGLWETFELINM